MPVRFGAAPAFRSLRSSNFFRRDAPISTIREAIGWWESRRLPFNLIVGCAGILTCISIGVVGLGSEIIFGSGFGVPDPPLFAVFGVLLYAFMANVLFTGGWLAEIVVRKLWPGEADQFATASFFLGLVFSVLLTLAPAVLVLGAAAFELIKRV